MNAKVGHRSPRMVKAMGCALLMLITLSLAVTQTGAKEYRISNYDIEMTVNSEGNFLITEYITYEFLEGSFSTAFREVPRTGFESLRFISLDGVTTPVEIERVSDGRRLEVAWRYPEMTDSATFALTYEAQGGLRSNDGRNIIDWNPIGSDWEVGIFDVDVIIQVPDSVTEVRVDPESDLVAFSDGQVHLHRRHVPANTHYHIVVSFPEVIPIVVEPSPPYLQWMLIGLAVGLAVMFVDVRLRGVEPVRPSPSGPPVTSLDFIEMATLSPGSYDGPRRGVSATIFSLGQRGTIRLAVEPKTSAFGSDRVRVEVLKEDDLSPGERIVVDGLKKRGTLQKFGQDTFIVSNAANAAKSSLRGKGLISVDRVRLQNRTLFTAFMPFLLSIGMFIYGGVTASPPGIALGVVLVLVALGRLINGVTIGTLSGEGLHTQEQVAKLIDEKMHSFEEVLKRDPQAGMKVFFGDLPYLILHRKFTQTKLQSLKKQFARLETPLSIDWIVAYGTGKVNAVGAISSMDSVNLMFVAILATSASSGATGVPGGGVGAGGSGAGGGGGGAG